MSCKAKAAIKGLQASATYARKLSAHCTDRDCKKKIQSYLIDIKDEIRDNQSYVKEDEEFTEIDNVDVFIEGVKEKYQKMRCAKISKEIAELKAAGPLCKKKYGNNPKKLQRCIKDAQGGAKGLQQMKAKWGC